MPWVPRGLRAGIVTTRYPRRPDGYGPGFHGAVVVGTGGVGGRAGADPGRQVREAAERCPTAAITLGAGGPRLDRGRCILCGRCVALAPEVFAFDPGFETAVPSRDALVVPAVDNGLGAGLGAGLDAALDAGLEATRRSLAGRVRALRRSVHVRHVDAGSDGSDEWEIAALTNPVYDVQRLGVFFTASPKHADLLLVTGAGARGMLAPLRHTYELMPEPKIVVAVGVDTVGGGMVGDGYATRGGVAAAVPVDVYVPGSPPSPLGILFGILLAVGILGRAGTSSAHGPARDRPRGTGS